jgi:hypothetical protein
MALRAEEVEDAAAERARAKFEDQCSKRAATKLKKTTDRAKETVAKRLAVTQKRKAKKLAKAARLSAAVLEGAEPGSASGAATKTLLDSGASTTFLTPDSARAAQLEGNVRVKVFDAQGKLITARGGGALFGKIKDKDGEWHKEQVATHAYESPDFADDLLSWPSLKRLGWMLRSGPQEGDDFLTSPDNRHYPLTTDADGLLFLDICLCPSESSASSIARSDLSASRTAFMAVLSPGKPKRFDSRKTKVNWASAVPSSMLATIGDGAMRSCLTPRSPLLLGPSSPAHTLPETTLDTELVRRPHREPVRVSRHRSRNGQTFLSAHVKEVGLCRCHAAVHGVR